MPNIFDTNAFGGPLGDAPGGLPSSRVGIAETFPRIFAYAQTAPQSAQWVATAIYLPANLKITGITFFAGSQALGTGTHQWFGLWDRNLALLRGSADDTSTAWAAHAAKRLALSTTFTTAYAGLYYVGVEVTVSAGNVPNLACMTGTAGNASPGGLRGLTPAATVLDGSTADTALAPTLTQTAQGNGSMSPLYAVLD